MDKTYYYPKTIRNLTIAFTDLFNDIVVKRLDDAGIVVKELTLPIKFGPVNKFQHNIMREESGKDYYIKLPSLAVTLDGLDFASDRAAGMNEYRNFYDTDLGLDDVNTFYRDVQPTPYNYNFSLHVLTESLDDFSQIMENILPYFNPTLHLRVKEFSFLNIERDIPVQYAGVTTDFLEVQEGGTKRYVNGTINFIVKGYMYRPLTDVKVIKKIESKYFTNWDLGTSASDVEVDKFRTSGFMDTSASDLVAPYAYDTSAVNDGGVIILKKHGDLNFDPNDLWLDDEGNYMLDGNSYIFDDEN